MDRKKRPCKHRVFFFTAYKNIKGDGRNFHVQTKGICLYVNSFTLIILQDSTSDDNPFVEFHTFVTF